MGYGARRTQRAWAVLNGARPKLRVRMFWHRPLTVLRNLGLRWLFTGEAAR